ncbi:MAG: terminase large subunit domain-containing protein, partial [Acidimicrobiales bacterium]
SAELVWKARDFAMKAGVKLRGDGSNRISLQFPNGSRIIGIPGREATLRGYSAVSLLIIDEASRVEDAVYKALRPMLAVGDGDLWLLSTPFGKRGFFYENWTAGGEEWVRVQVAATECARISKDFLAESSATSRSMS